ncbi:DMT family transporter [Adlercreutzia murintestinalis]|uniref:DMT family transporter n=1 Tax=Adlercreutzia murintestinalis TaxID=2941325 RepID=UPI00204261A4|nr:SMR family transporter [Adlercreutzia murintestinalis]
MPYVLLALAIGAEVFGTSMMKLSDGFKRKLPILGIAAGYVISFALLGFVLRDLPLSVAMGIWAGAGTALTAVVAAVAWKEGMGIRKAMGILLIVGGVLLLEMGVNA